MQVVKNRIISRIRKIISVWIFVQIGFVFSANAGDIVITEFFYNKSAGNLPEYVELFNTTDSIINLEDWKLAIDGTQVEIDGGVCSVGLSYTDETACTNAGGAWDPFSINSNAYVVILSSSGLLRNEDGTTYCSSSHYGFPFNVCDSTIDNLFWRIGTFSGLSNTFGTIKIWDNANTSNVIDSVAYDMAAGFPVGDDVLGRAAVFIIDPTSVDAFEKNDDGNNWRSSEHPSEYLWNGSSSDFGSPLSSHFITPSISIEAYATPDIDSTKNTICAFVSDSTICQPGSDGRPGGYAAIQLTGSAVNVSGADVTLDSLYWEINKNILLSEIDSLWDISSEIDSIWHPIPLLQDTNSFYSVYTIPLFTRDTCGFLGKTDTTIYIKREINEKPSVFKLNGQISQAVINVFENTYNSLYAEVTDPELCSSINAPCNFDSLTFNRAAASGSVS